MDRETKRGEPYHSSNLQFLQQYVKQNVPQSEDAKVPIVLIGNKIDLEDQRVITHNQGLQVCHVL